MTDKEMEAMEAEASRLAHALQAEVEKICQDLDPEDPDVKKLRGAVASMSRNIDAARELGGPDPIMDKIRARQKEPIYTWEKLPVYEWNNEFARVIGRLLAVLPKRFYVHAHNLAGQATLISNCIALGHRDMPPGEVAPVEELRAYRNIGHHATFSAAEMLTDLSQVTKAGQSDIARGLELVAMMRQQFEKDIAEIEPRPQLIH